jgi:hypothetical protein
MKLGVMIIVVACGERKKAALKFVTIHACGEKRKQFLLK